MKCEPQLQEQHAVEILLKNIHSPIAFLLKGFTIKTFEKLLNKASNLQEEAHKMPFLREQSEDKKVTRLVKTFEKKAVVSAADKGKRSMANFQLPEARRPEDESKKDDPKYCPYHRMLSHPLEDSVVFKDWLERNYTQGNIIIPKEYLVDLEKAYIKTISAQAPTWKVDLYASQEDVEPLSSPAKGQKMNKKHPSASVLTINHGNEMQVDVSHVLNQSSVEESLNIKEIDLLNQLFKKKLNVKLYQKGQARYHENIWQAKIKNNPTSGIGFGTVSSFDDDEYCLMITYHLESPNVPTDPFYALDGLYLETLDDPDDLRVQDAPLVKSKVKEAHLYDLRVVFERLRRYDLKMNPLKCAFGVTSGKFLGFVVTHRGIEIDPAKIEAILDMPPSKSLTQLRSLQGRLAYIRRFISNLYGRCLPFSVLAKKDTKFVWDKKCQNAFDDIKQYLSNPPVLAAPISGKPLILYTAALDESLGALLAQVNDEEKEKALYYLSRRLLPTEIRYPSTEKHYLALVFATQKLRHYMLSHSISLISRITFTRLRAVKGQAVAEFLAAHPLPAESPLNDDLPDEQIMSLRESDEAIWELYIDGVASSCRNAT
ncbi:uncharacterized protein LOC114581406 [Dendrobium catenatum]|uniref:uncharacterized protein LOC114581406 n=1 Tax=Dendrobium catenatum TaxID=906689 RepID=UPI00109FBD79|nr:uncharacterized protein LOC114581406 [Dendrobium catenatum]